MRWPDPAAGPAHLANRALADQDWAREKLAPFAGRSFSLRLGPLLATWTIGPDGTFASAAAGAPVDLTLTLSPLSVPAFLADPSRWNASTVPELQSRTLPDSFSAELQVGPANRKSAAGTPTHIVFLPIGVAAPFELTLQSPAGARHISGDALGNLKLAREPA